MISAKRISKIFGDVAGSYGEGSLEKIGDDNVIQGVMKDRYFTVNLDKLDTYREEIKKMLLELNPDFSQGWTFVQLPFDRNGNQWGEQHNAEELMVLGMALGYISFTFPNDIWKGLPGRMPYVTIMFDKLVSIGKDIYIHKRGRDDIS